MIVMDGEKHHLSWTGTQHQIQEKQRPIRVFAAGSKDSDIKNLARANDELYRAVEEMHSESG